MTTPSLDSLRVDIDDLDTKIVALLAERFRKTRTIGEIKLQTALPVSIPARVQHRAQLVRSLAERNGMDPKAALAIYASINRETVVGHQLQGVPGNG